MNHEPSLPFLEYLSDRSSLPCGVTGGEGHKRQTENKKRNPSWCTRGITAAKEIFPFETKTGNLCFSYQKRLDFRVDTQKVSNMHITLRGRTIRGFPIERSLVA